jgi:ferric-dicitrate binding protein FerR (iron transport regulator)
MKYMHYSAEDLALDESFQKWVLDSDEKEDQFWTEWMKNNPERKKEIDKAVSLVQMAGLSADQEANAAYLNTWSTLKANAERSEKERQARRLRYAIRAAAIFTGVLAVAAYILWNNLGASGAIEYKTAFGEVKEFVLEDGSRVTLNSNSQLTCTGDWNNTGGREVYLQGEAFFEVMKTEDKRSFIVRTKEQVEVLVLGTAFNVNTRRGQISVYLQEGSVKVKALSGGVILKPGELAEYDKTEANVKVTTEAAGAEDRLAWKNNLFVFNDTPLSEVTRDIEDNFGVSVEVADSTLNNKRITAKVPRNEMQVLLQVLSATLEVAIEEKDDRLIIRPAD